MPNENLARWLLGEEAKALLTRVRQLRPFALQAPMVSAASVSPAAQAAIERVLERGRKELGRLVRGYQRWLLRGEGRCKSPAEAQQRLAVLRMRFNEVISQFDIFSDVLSQRSVHETGVWLSGLDALATDALTLPGDYYAVPPVVCLLGGGIGASIRRVGTPLPGGPASPVAVVRLPRERLVGIGIASCCHEIGHQGAALLDLVNSLGDDMLRNRPCKKTHHLLWEAWRGFLPEVIADMWSVARVGIASTLGLIGLMSLPSAFVFRVTPWDRHPAPWLRVKLSCALGDALYPHAQWQTLSTLWEEMYPLPLRPAAQHKAIKALEGMIPWLIERLVEHKPPSLRGVTIGEAFEVAARQPARLASLFRYWERNPGFMEKARPSLAFAVIGQARANGQITPEDESRRLSNLLTHWALESSLHTAQKCAQITHGTKRNISNAGIH